jgi:feruloyl esterase
MVNTNCSTTPCVGKPFPMSVDWIRLLVRRDPEYNLTTMTLRDLEDNYALSRRFLGPIIAANDPDLSRFRASRAKMISWHGMADECITVRSTRAYFDSVLAVDPAARDYYRHFEAPGVNHCNALPGGYYPLRALDALVRWVEGGIAPDVLIGYKLPNVTYLTEEPAESRPICMYPDVLKYNGGDLAKYGSYRCGPKEEMSAARARVRDEL